MACFSIIYVSYEACFVAALKLSSSIDGVTHKLSPKQYEYFDDIA